MPAPAAPTPRPWPQALARLAARLVLLAALLYAGHLAYEWISARIGALDGAAQTRALAWLVVAGVIVYALLIALPFMPAIEVGLALMMLDAARLAPVVYIATVLGLMLSFTAGRLVAPHTLAAFLADLRLMRAARLMTEIAAAPPRARMGRLIAALPQRAGPLLARARYLAVAVLLNLPGNIVLGGGGGIMLAAGVSRLFEARLMALVVAVAVAPVPFLVWLYGKGYLAAFPVV